MKLIANSLMEYAGKKYLPGQTLPDGVPEELQQKWLRVGYAVKGPEMKKQIDEPLPVPSESMTVAQLRELAAQYGVDAESAKTKAEIIGLIKATGKVPQ